MKPLLSKVTRVVSEAGPLEEHSSRQSEPDKRLKFAKADGFQTAVRRRVDEYFRSTGLRPQCSAPMYRKTAVVLAWLATSYVLLVFLASAWWLAIPLAISLGLAMAAVGFNIQHDGGHHAYSERSWVNRLMALTMDLVGGSSYVWRWKHAVVHHTFANITGHDDDINLAPLARLTPHQKRFAFHRFQHWYLWPLYGLFAIKWEFFDDFHNVLTGRIGAHRFPRPGGWDLLTFLGGKAVFFTLALGVPLLLHSVRVALLYYGVVSCVLGVVLGVVFQLAHCVEQAAFPLPQSKTGRMENAWAIHQVETTVDFAPRSRVAAWLLGGLNFQIEHHLFPRVCHTHYPALAPLVEQTCREFGVRYIVHDTFWSGLASHYRWLRRLGTAD
jgi:linoleoyl-CoA desaturase